SLAIIGVHGMLSGTASMDFGGKHNAGVAVGNIHGFVYLGTGLQALVLGRVLPRDGTPEAAQGSGWHWGPIVVVPARLGGTALPLRPRPAPLARARARRAVSVSRAARALGGRAALVERTVRIERVASATRAAR